LLVFEHLFVYTVVRIRVEVIVLGGRLLRRRTLLVRSRLRLLQASHTNRQAAKESMTTGRVAGSHTRNDGVES